MSTATTPFPTRVSFRTALARGFRASWLTIALVAAINTGIAGVLWIDDARPFWHPFVSAQLQGFSIAWCVNVARPWDAAHPLRRLIVAVAVGSVIGIVLVILAKGYTWSYVTTKHGNFLFNFVVAFFNGVFFSLFFYVKLSAARAQATLARAEAERHLLSKQAVVHTVELGGVKARLVRFKDGRLNIDDLLAKDDKEPPARFDIAGCRCPRHRERCRSCRRS